MKRTKQIKRSLLKKTAALATSVIMLASSLSFPELKDGFKDMFLEVSAAVDTSVININYPTIYTLEQLYQFSEDYYNNPGFYQRAKVEIVITEAVEISPTYHGKTWRPIGGKAKDGNEYPFGGVIYISTTAAVQNFTVNMPLFENIYDSVETYSLTPTLAPTPPQKINLVRNDDADTALFANNVISDPLKASAKASPARWDITTTGSGKYTGIINTADEGAEVNLDLTLNSNAAIESSGNAGIICGTMKKDSKVNAVVSSSSTATINTVTSTNESAGGLVGEMCQGSELDIVAGNILTASSTRTITGKTYAGGLVGKNDQGTVVIKEQTGTDAEGKPEYGGDLSYDAKGNVYADTGSGSAGGIFGYYKVPSANNKFSSNYYKSTTGCTLKGKTVGGLVGVLEGNGNDLAYSGTSTARVSVKSAHSDSSGRYGGIIGRYSNTSLQNKLEIEYVDVEMSGSGATYYGGVLGSLSSEELASAVYVKVNNFTLNSRSGADGCTDFGGVIGAAGDKGSLIDVGTVKITTGNGYKGGGIVGQLNKGVLRLSGTTDLSDAVAASGGQIVGERTDALVYALGDGNSSSAAYENGWRFVRSSSDYSLDDIGVWGEVLRIANVEDKDPADSSDKILVYDSDAHTVTVAAAVTNMRSNADAVKTALNMQLNDGSLGALRFESSSNRTSLLSSDLTVFGNISFSGTGITGFMRDGSTSSASVASEIKYFTGTLGKGFAEEGEEDTDAVITLAVGENYGVYSGGVDNGAIYRHTFNGMFACTGDGAKIEDITINGTMNINASADDIHIGGAVSFVKNSVTISNVNVSESINYKYRSGTSHYVGGLIGSTSCDEGKTVSISGSSSSSKASISPVINVTGSCLDNDAANVKQSIAGLIGFISSTAGTESAQTETQISNIKLSATVDASAAVGSTNEAVAGLIADIAWNSTDTRKLTLSNIDVEGTTVKSSATNTTGGILGYRWFGTDVVFDDVTLATGDVANEINTPSKYVGGLVYKATGHWTVNNQGIVINSIAFKNNTAVAAPSGLGMIVHDGHYSNSGLFLELNDVNSYNLAGGLEYIPTMTGKIYDELCACLSKDAASLLTNSTAGVISYHTSGGVYTSTEGTKNSYNNVYNQAVVNNRSRYYYNADSDSFASNSDDDSYKLLSWSLNRYAASNIKRCFTNPFSNNVLTGDFDLNNISYYPIDVGSNVKIGDANIIFYNAEIESAETASNTKRSTRDGKSQHYLMHMGLFKDVTATIETTDNVAVSGSVGTNSTYSGALINGTLTGTLKTAADKTISLGREEQVKVGRVYVSKFYPLLLEDSDDKETDRYYFINSIGSKAVLDLNGLYVYVGDDYTDGDVYASSLIGDVVGIGINLKFSNISVDGRNKENVATCLDNIYGTTRSVFEHASLLNKYDVDPTSVAIYNFSQSEDWIDSSSRSGSVTYGKELRDTVEYKDPDTNKSEENRYYEDGENGNYIDPEDYPGAFVSGQIANDEYIYFSTIFLPYVRYYNVSVDGAPEASYTLREIKVNVVPSDLSSGCGTYDHPYEISGAKQLKGVADMLDALSGYEPIPSVRLPADKSDASHWCCSETGNTCILFNYENGAYRATGTNVTWSKDEVRAYLAKAYYQITGPFTITTGFTGLGGTDSTYAFKGVIVGKNANITITNKSARPLIKISNGSVVKDLKIVVDNKSGSTYTSVLQDGDSSTKFSYSDNKLVYGGVIGKVMGGDNIIDNVEMTYNNEGYVQVPSTNAYLDCVGGYVGAVVNGGLIFRNMTENSFVSKSDFKVNTSIGNAKTTNWAADNDDAASHSHLYINPYVGRVINGYAINETTSYSGDSKEYTLDNGTKNYQISDVKVNVADADNATTEKLYYDTLDSKNRVNIPTGQSLFILSLITQSGAGTAIDNDTGRYQYGVGYDPAVSSNSYDTYSAAKKVATHDAQYNEVGNVTYANKNTSDYAVSAKDMINNSRATPYIIYHYTRAASNGLYPARMMTGNTEFMKLTTAGGTYNLPKSFRGIGSICRFKGGSTAQVQQKGNFNYNWTYEDEDGKFAMKIYGFDGNNSTINIHLGYNIYYNELDNYSSTIYGKNNMNLGFGLFNYVVHKSNATTTMSNALGGKDSRPETSVIPNYNLADGYYIGKFTLSGSVKVNEYKNDGSSAPIAYSTSELKSQERRRFSVGGVIGALTINNYVNFFKLNMSNMTVEGANDVGGYIGRNNVTERNADSGLGMNYIYANACNADGLVIKANGGYCGGIAAGGLSGYLDLFVNTAKNTVSTDVESRGDDGYYKSTMSVTIKNSTNIGERGTGGVLGSIRNGYMSNLWINNVVVTGNGDDPVIENSHNNTTDTNGTGGLIGFVRKADTIILTNSIVKNINITGPSAGGLTGCISYDTGYQYYGLPPVMKVYNCKVINNDDSKTYSISGKAIAGGIAGNFKSNQSYSTAANAKGYDYDSTKNNVYTFDIDGCEVHGYTIQATGTNNNDNGAGGIIGYAAQATRTVVNSSVHDCIIKIDGSRDRYGMGGIVGNTAIAVWGYNVAAYNNNFSFANSGTSAKYGGFIGNSQSQVLKIAGFTRKNNNLVTSSSTTTISADTGSSTGSGSYVIDADYMNVSMTDGHGTSMAVGFDNGTNVDEGARTEYFPYVTVSPNISAGGTSILTGDGISIVSGDPLAKTIVSEYTSGAADNRIKYSNVSSTDINKVKGMLDGTDTDIKITTYDKEMGLPAAYENNGGQDFPIIAIGGAKVDYNDYINAYIRTLTNTTGNYNQNSSGNYIVDLYPCKCIGGVYQKSGSATDCGLQLSSGKFVYVDAKADSIAGQNQFTMIDIRFLDPTNSNKTAYHLYVPVLTKKLLKFNFSSTALQGSEYEPSIYKEKIESIDWDEITKLGAGFDSWQTIYVQFEYTKEEVNKFLNSGKALNWNAPKRIQFEYQGDRSIADSTQFVLLDNNNGVDKEYYLTKQDDGVETAISANQNAYDVINFGAFTTDRNKASAITPSETFEAHIQTLNDIAGNKVVYSIANNDGSYVLCANQTTHEDAIAYAYDKSSPTDNSKKWFKAYSAGDAGPRYKLEVTDDIVESYYLSMYTFKEDNDGSGTTNNAYGFIVDCPMTITSDVITCQRENAKNTAIYLGQFLKQTMIISRTAGDYNDNVRISTDNNILKAKLISTVEFDAGAETLTSYFYKNLTNEKLYQGYMLYLNRYDKDGNLDKESTIKNNKSYSIVSKRNGDTVKEYSDSIDDGEAYLYIDPIEITVTAQQSGVWQSTQEVDINLTFEPDEKKLMEEFTSRSNDIDRNGVQFDAAARLDFVSDRVPYSNNIQKASEVPGIRYYVDRSKVNGKLSLNAIDQAENDEYDPYGEQSHNKSSLGINAKYIDQGSKYPEKGDTEYISIGMDYDISQLPEDDIFDGNHALKLTIKLNQKQNADNTSGYKYQPVNIQDDGDDLGYLENFKLIGKPDTSALILTEASDDGYLYYTYTMPLPENKQGMAIQYNDDNNHFNANFEFDVKTAAKLEAIPGYRYANYKFEVTAEITGSSYSSTDHIVYTNAKVNAEYVEKKSAG